MHVNYYIVMILLFSRLFYSHRDSLRPPGRLLFKILPICDAELRVFPCLQMKLN
jgi:hypothetical protein